MNLIKSDIVPLYGSVASRQGGRPENQDDFGFVDTPLGFLLIVCDGMGGGPGGKTASYIVKYEITKTLCECNEQTPRDKAMRMAVVRAHEALVEKMNEVPSLQGMGATFVAVLINQHSALVAHAGDSRCYRLHGKHIFFRTKDHSLVGELVRTKALTEEQARVSPQSNIISRGLGSVSNNTPDVVEIPYSKGDRFVLCTDGVWGSMPHKDLIQRFSAKTDIQRVVENVSSEVERIGVSKGYHHDNHTLAIIETGSSSILRDKFKKNIMMASLSVLVVAISAVLAINNIDSNLGQTVHNSGVVVNPNHRSSLSDAPDYPVEDLPPITVVDLDSLQEKYKEQVAAANDSIKKKQVNTDSLKQNKVEPKKQSKNNKKKQDNVVSRPSDLTQKIINCYDQAKTVREKEQNMAARKVDELRNEISDLFKQLHNQMKSDKTTKKEALSKVEGIRRQHDNQKIKWYVYEEKKGSKVFQLVPKVTNHIDCQIERLKELKVMLK